MSKNEKKLNFWIKAGRILFSSSDSVGKTAKYAVAAGVGLLVIGFTLSLGSDLANYEVKKYKKLLQVENNSRTKR